MSKMHFQIMDVYAPESKKNLVRFKTVQYIGRVVSPLNRLLAFKKPHIIEPRHGDDETLL
jgi:hypothetical protein